MFGSVLERLELFWKRLNAFSLGAYGSVWQAGKQNPIWYVWYGMV